MGYLGSHRLQHNEANCVIDLRTTPNEAVQMSVMQCSPDTAVGTRLWLSAAQVTFTLIVYINYGVSHCHEPVTGSVTRQRPTRRTTDFLATLSDVLLRPVAKARVPAVQQESVSMRVLKSIHSIHRVVEVHRTR